MTQKTPTTAILPADESTLSNQEVNGTVKYILYDTLGRIRGVVLNNGVQVHFKEASTDAVIETGQDIHVSGTGTENRYGRAIMTEATP